MNPHLKSTARLAVLTAALALGSVAHGQNGPSPTPVLGGPPSAGYRTSGEQPTRQVIPITAGKSATIDFDRDLRIGGTTNPKVADVRMVTARHAAIMGVGYGQTDAQFYDANGRLVLVVDVRVEQDMKAINDMMARIIPSAQITTQAINDSIVLTGLVQNASEADKAVQIAGTFAGKPDQVKNLLTIAGKEQVTLKVQVVEVNRSVVKQLGFDTNFLMGQLGMPQYVIGNTPTYAVNGGFQGGLGAGYQVNTTSQPVANLINQISRVPFGDTGITATTFAKFVDSFLRGNGPINAAQTGWVKNYLDGFIGTIHVTDQVSGLNYGMTDVGITTANLQGMAQNYLAGGAGLTGAQQAWMSSFFATLPSYNTTYEQLTDSSFIDRSNPANPVGTDRIGSKGLNQGRSMIQAFERQGLVRTLAEPNLTATSGEAAKFLAGGEYPVPTGRDQQGNVTVEFKPYGVGLGFTPVVLSAGRISLKISTEVSELTTQGALTLSGIAGSGSATVIPALTVRRVENTIELPSGGSMMIAGLLQEQTRQNIDKVPGIADVPILGALARSRDFLNNETELVIIVTAYLTGPANPNALQTPADGLRIASDPETLLLGKLNTAYKAPPQATEGRTYQGPFGHVIE